MLDINLFNRDIFNVYFLGKSIKISVSTVRILKLEQMLRPK